MFAFHSGKKILMSSKKVVRCRESEVGEVDIDFVKGQWKKQTIFLIVFVILLNITPNASRILFTSQKAIWEP